MSEIRDHFVYEVYDADGLLLYVGCTGNLTKRMADHRRGNADARGWFDSFIDRWQVSGPYPKAVALRIEKDRIDERQPIWNGQSLGNRNGRKQIAAYLQFHGVRFEQHPYRNKPNLVPLKQGRRSKRRLSVVA